VQRLCGYIKLHLNPLVLHRGFKSKTFSGAGTGYILDGPANDRNVSTVFASVPTGLFLFLLLEIMLMVNMVLALLIRRGASSRFASSEDGVLLLFKCSLEH
jgi:hypothetical protein